MKIIEITDIKSMDFRLILIGIGLGMLFWVFESAAHVFFFRDTGFLISNLFSSAP